MDLMPLNVLDGLIIVTLGWNFVRGFNKGFVEEIISITGIILDIYISYLFAHPVAKFIVSKSQPQTGEVVVSGLLIFLILFLITKYIAFSVNRLVNKTNLGFINHILGFLFGIFRGILICSLVVFVVSVVAPNSYLVKKSSLGGIAVPVMDRIIHYLPMKHRNEDPIIRKWRIARETLWKNFIFKRYLKGGKFPLKLQR